ncbi:MAG: hypothetical protein MUF68_09370 [Cyclobacteriaceae bacterium]|jgi:Tol biopolymer transport system component|nr:hypothetical protein [Cyclobacteriaceae bacterium]
MMKSFKLTFVALLSAAMLQAQPGTEIWLFDLSVKKNKISITNGKNITNRKGYDNQPHFHKNLPIIYFSSIGEDGRAEIFTYNFENALTEKFTATQEREYSPTLTPDEKNISCIIQRDNGAQDLGLYQIDTKEVKVIVNQLTVGYHAWLTADELALFVLEGENALPTLRLYSLQTQSDSVIARNIGRSLHRLSGKDAFSYVQKNENGDNEIFVFDRKKKTSTSFAKTLPKREDLVWLNNGFVLMSDGESLFYLDKNKWIKIESFNADKHLKNITRLAVDVKNKKLAIVAEE